MPSGYDSSSEQDKIRRACTETEKQALNIYSRLKELPFSVRRDLQSFD